MQVSMLLVWYGRPCYGRTSLNYKLMLKIRMKIVWSGAETVCVDPQFTVARSVTASLILPYPN